MTLLDIAAGSDDRSDKLDTLLDDCLWCDPSYQKIMVKDLYLGLPPEDL